MNGKSALEKYVRKGNELPDFQFIRDYQIAVKNFCEDSTRSIRNDESTFCGEPSIIFFNKPARLVAIFYPDEPKKFISAYKITQRQVDIYYETSNIGRLTD